MALLTIRTFPDPVLKEKSKPVEEVGEDVLNILGDMAETMYANRGVGLAAPQVGVGLRLIVVDVKQGEENGGELLKLINPRITEKEGKKKSEEGCLSLPELIVDIDRYEKVTVEALDPSGETCQIEAEGLLSVALQHEIDHLDGVLLVDRLSSLRRSLYQKKRLREESGSAGASNG
jgi:peptide deformylase